MNKVIDILFVAIIIICGWTGYKKGIIMGIGGILVIVVSIYGGNLLSNTFSYDIIPAIRPFASGYMEPKYEESIYGLLGIVKPVEPDVEVPDEFTIYDPDPEPLDERLTYSMDDLIDQNPNIEQRAYANAFKTLGINDSTAMTMAEEVMEYSEAHEESRYDSMIEVLCRKLTYTAGFILFFFLILILLTVVINIPNLSFKIPGADIINDIGGAILGLVTGLMFCAVLAWVLKFMGIIIGGETLESLKFAGWFMKKDFLGVILGL